jgi:hypothetical protein
MVGAFTQDFPILQLDIASGGLGLRSGANPFQVGEIQPGSEGLDSQSSLPGQGLFLGMPV